VRGRWSDNAAPHDLRSLSLEGGLDCYASRGPQWVSRVVLAVRQLFPVSPDEQTFAVFDGTSQKGHNRL